MSKSDSAAPPLPSGSVVAHRELGIPSERVGFEDVTQGTERFTAKDLAGLRSDLLQSGVDSFQAAEIVALFLGGRGYGISTDEARLVVSKIEGVGISIEHMGEELSRVARVA